MTLSHFRNRCVEIHVPPESVSPASRRLLAKHLRSNDLILCDLSAAAGFNSILQASVSCGLSSSVALHLARETIAKATTTLDVPLQLFPTPSASVALVSAHPVAATAIFQLNVLDRLMARQHDRGLLRHLVVSFLKFSTRESLPLRLHLLKQHHGVGEVLREEELLPIWGGKEMEDHLDRRFFGEVSQDASDDNFRVLRLDLTASRSSVLPSNPAASSVELSNMSRKVEASVDAFLDSLADWSDGQMPVSCDTETWLLLWKATSPACALREVFEGRTEGEVKMLLSMGRRMLEETCHLLTERGFSTRLTGLSPGFLVGIKALPSKGWTIVGEEERWPSQEECQRSKELLTFAEGCSPYLDDVVDLEESRRRILTHMAFLSGVCNVPRGGRILLSGRNDYRTASLEDALTSASNLTRFCVEEEEEEASSLIPSLLHPLSTKLALNPATGHKMRWSRLQRGNAMLLHHLLRQEEAEDVILLARNALNRKGNEEEEHCSSLEGITDAITFATETRWLLARNWKAWKAGNLQDWRLMYDVATALFRDAVKSLGYSGDRGENLLTFLNLMKSSLPGDLDQVLNRCIASVTAFEENSSPLGAGRALVACSLALGEIVSALLFDRGASMEAEATLLRSLSSGARFSARADLCCFTLSYDDPTLVEDCPFVRHHPLHSDLSTLSEECGTRASALEASRPVRIEPWQQLESEVRGLLDDGPMAGDVVWNLVRQLTSGEEEGTRAKLDTWKRSLANFVRDVQIKFSSYRDVIGPVCAAVLQAMAGMTIVARQTVTTSLQKLDESFPCLSQTTTPREDDFRKLKETYETTYSLASSFQEESLLSFSQQTLRLLLSTKRSLLELLPPALAARASTARLLEDHWPDNPVLLEIERRLGRLLSHSVWDPERSFQLALEETVVKVEEWNGGCPARYAVPAVSEMRAILDGWKRTAILQFKKVTAELEAGARSDGALLSERLSQLSARVMCSSDLGSRRKLLAAAAFLFIQSATVLDYSTRCQVMYSIIN